MATGFQFFLPFACIDFPDKSIVTTVEIAAKLDYSLQHVLDHVEAGKLVAIDSSLAGSRRNLRVPIGEYRRWVLSMLTSEQRRQMLAEITASLLSEGTDPKLQSVLRALQPLVAA